MNKIICFINLGMANARVYELNIENEQKFITDMPLEKLSEGLAATSAMYKINNITLIGSPSYADGIVPEIIEYAKTNFNNNDLIVEVMR